MINDLNLGKLIAEGKTKKIYAHSLDSNLVYMVNKDYITAGDGVRRNPFVGKAHWSTVTAANIFTLLNKAKIATHFIKQVNENTLLVSYCKMLPIEQVQRRIATGSYLKNHPNIKEGTRFEPVLVETYFKDDARHDPQIWEDDIIEMGLATAEEIHWMAEEGRRVFEVLEGAWTNRDIVLVDLKIEFGRNIEGKLIVADVIDNDSWRLWPLGDKSQMLDKQIYRNLSQVTEQDLKILAEKYSLVADLTTTMK